ncbi:MAG: ketol-acid reductoisomerase [Patescibacteria group bacterium]|jgi:ketol-acid reductoisomerase|nr:ketol-acid reductoisomerase [Patescibacteria group bacterium]
MKTHESSVFPIEGIEFSTGVEQVVRGGRHLFPYLIEAFAGIRQIGFIGWGSQGPAQAQNLRDSLEVAESDIVVKVGLQEGSKSLDKARGAGFTEEDGTLGEMFEVIRSSDLVILLISDGAQTKLYKEIFAAMKPGATLGLSHGFLYGHLQSIGEDFPDNINVIMMAPKGMGASVRQLYLQGKEVNGAGINSSVAVHQDVSGLATDYALGWAVGTGSPATFFTTLEKEVISDLTGERSMLLGGLWGLVEARFDELEPIWGFRPSFLEGVQGITSTVSRLISQYGLLGFYKKLDEALKPAFELGYRRAYDPAFNLIAEIRNEVSSWREVADVVSATEALKVTPMSNVEASSMWRVARENDLYGKEVEMTELLAETAGMYIAGVMAQMEVLRAFGHSTSEVVNEALIEGIDSLNPFMNRSGVGRMVDGCSTTARLGTRKWGPKFQEAFRSSSSYNDLADSAWEVFLENPLHGDIEICFGFRPSVALVVD